MRKLLQVEPLLDRGTPFAPVLGGPCDSLPASLSELLKKGSVGLALKCSGLVDALPRVELRMIQIVAEACDEVALARL